MAPSAHSTTGSDHAERITILVLETDSVFPDTKARKGTFGHIFHEVFAQAGREHDPAIEVETRMKFVVADEGGDVPVDLDILDGVQGVLITGSKWDAHGDQAWILGLLDWVRGACAPACLSPLLRQFVFQSGLLADWRFANP
jgi:hypothetical protein